MENQSNSQEIKSVIITKRKASRYWIIFSIITLILIFGSIGIAFYLLHIGYFDNIIKQLQPQINNQYNIPERNITVLNSINVSIDPPSSNVTINNNIVNVNSTN